MNKQQKLLFYIRETPAFFLIWLSMLLLYAAICSYTNQMGQDEFYRVIFFLRNNLVVAINVVALLILSIHLIIWIKDLSKNCRNLSKLMFFCGTWAAIFAPIMMVIVGYIIPFGNVAERSYLLKLMGTMHGKIIFCLMIILPIWYALPRILETIHTFNIHPKREKMLILVLAFAWSAHAIYLLFVR
ncbi:hypothetical protein PT276_02250 [Orbaceae bacterium ESL0721]|nr:hypothetical protein [Orbaceae bacterium ESL0721]